MNTAPDTLSDPQDLDLQQAEADVCMAQEHERLLGKLLKIGMNLAEMLEAEIEARILGGVDAPADSPRVFGGDPMTDFAKIAQALRRTIVLRERVHAGLGVNRKTLSTESAKRRRNPNAAAEDAFADIQIAVGDAIYAKFGDERPEVFDALNADVENLLDVAGAYEDYADRPVGEVVAGICQLLGLDPDWSRWDGEQWVIKPCQWKPTLSEFVTPWVRPEPPG